MERPEQEAPVEDKPEETVVKEVVEFSKCGRSPKAHITLTGGPHLLLKPLQSWSTCQAWPLTKLKLPSSPTCAFSSAPRKVKEIVTQSFNDISVANTKFSFE